MNTHKARVYIIGAGPGDPELITIKGLRILQTAECVLYDFLSNIELLAYTKDECEKICVGKADGLHLKEQKEINEMLYAKALEYKTVVRLKGGDPFIFSRGYEEARYLKNKNISVEVIPGITSAIAGPEVFGIPLTIKNTISSAAIVAGRKKDKDAIIEAPQCGTLIYLMAVANITNVVKALVNSGRASDVPCAFIERATHVDSRIICATVGTIKAVAHAACIQPPAVLVVGDVVKEYEHTNMFS